MTLRIKVSADTANTVSINNLVTTLKPVTKSINIIKGGIIIDPILNEQSQYEIPTAIKNEKFILLIDATERGGLNEQGNFAQVVCGMSGKAIKPYFIPRKNVVECGIHAHFSIPESCILIQSEGDSNITIKEVMIQSTSGEENQYASLIEKDYYVGHLDSIPAEFLRFKQAAEIAVDKSNCDKCTHVHYYVDSNQIFTKPKKSNQNKI